MATEYNIRVTASTSDADSKIQKTKKELDELGDVARESAKKTEKGFNASGVVIDELDKKTDGLASKFLGVVDAAKKAALSIKAMAAATIIGAVIAAAVAVVFYFKEMNRLVTETADKLKNETTGALKAQVTLLERQIKLGNLQGKQTEELQKQRIEILNQLKEQNEREIKSLEIQLQRLEATKLERNIWQQIEDAAIGAFLGQGEVAKRQALRIWQNLVEIEALRKQLTLLKAEGVETEIAIFDALNPNSKTKDEKREKQVGVRDKGLKQGEDTRIQEARDQLQALADLDAEFLELTFNQQLAADKRREEQEKLHQETIKNLKRTIISQSLNLIADLAKKGSGIAKAAAIGSIVAEQIRSVSEIITNTAIANAKAVAASPLTAGQPFVTLNTVSAGLGIAGGLVAATKAISDINSDKKTLSGGSAQIGGGGGGGPRAPQFNLVKGTDSNQIQEGIQGQQRPLKAFVVGEEMTTQQQLDRRIASDSSI